MLYNAGRPTTSARPLCSTSPRSKIVCIVPSTFTPRTCSTSARVTGCRYAMIASVSSAACESRVGRAFTPTSVFNHGAYSGCVTNCHAPATHASR